MTKPKKRKQRMQYAHLDRPRQSGHTTYHRYECPPNKYTPHQGKQEMARRVRQREKLSARPMECAA